MGGLGGGLGGVRGQRWLAVGSGRRLGEEDNRQRWRPCKNLSTQAFLAMVCRGAEPAKSVLVFSVLRFPASSVFRHSVWVTPHHWFPHHLITRYYRGCPLSPLLRHCASAERVYAARAIPGN